MRSFLSLIHSAVDLTITFFSTLNPIYALVLSILFVGGWVGTASKWIGCGYGADESNTCPEFILEITNHALQTPRVVIGFLVFALYIAYAVFAALAVHKARKFSRERTAANLKMNVVESQQS